ncbi:MAG: right-handed parallel beta-helix repeat-containing protein, partial [Flavobacteriales bacterium]|nr:right-handed parallel beta-helix repeat-containing protein [Flavobacteriales bacterium]
MKKRYKFLTALIFSSAIGFSQTATLPLYEDFESESQGYTSCASSTTINLASTVFSNGTGDDSDWSPDKGGTVSSNTGPTVNNGADHNPGTSSGYYLYIETSGCYNKTTNLESVYMDWSSESGVKIDFWYHMYGSAMGTMHFDIRQGNGAWQNDFITSWTDNQDVWQLQSISVFDPNYVGRDSVQIRVRGISGTSFSSDMALDDFSITPISGLDLEATALASPSLPTCAGSQLFELTVTNMGTNVVTSFNSYFKYNGSLVDTDVFSGTLNPGASTTITFNSQVVAAGSNLVQMYTASPNGKADGNLTNDTLNLSLSPALSGVYTIDANGTPSTTTYTSFQSLINDLSSNGICGPVTINVAAGTYSTPVTIESINGTSATNTITFDGGDSSSTIITHNSNGQYGTVLFNGVSYITFKNFGIVSTGTSNAVGVMFVNSEHCTVSNCEISVPTSSNSTVMPVTYSGSTTSTTSAGSNHYNFLTDNKLDGGYYGVRLYGTSSDYGKYNQVLNNVMTNIYYYGIYTYYQDSTVISGNAIDVTAASNVNADGVYAYYTFNADFIGNTISAPDYGLYVSQITTVRPARTKKTRLINNMVYSSGDYGVYLYGVDSVDFLHNTVVNEGTNPAVYFYTSTSTSYDPIDNYDIRNNIMYSTTAEAIEFLNCTDAIADNFDNNLFYTGGSVLVKNGTSTYADLSAYQTANGLMNINSVEGDPGFLSSTDLHVAGALANDAGDNSVGITVDIDGDTRPYSGSTIVDIGADEFTPPSCLQPSSLSESNITASAASLTWTENNAATQWQVSYGLSGFTAGNGTQVVTSSNPQNITALLSGTTYDWYVRTSCGRNNSSAWAGPNTFTTLAAPVTIPYYQDFEGTNPLTDFTINIGTDAGLQIDASSNCTGTNSLHMTGGTSSGWSGSSGATGTSTTQAWVTNSTKISDASLNVDATSATNNLTLSFDLKQTWSYGPGYSWARILVNGTQISPDYHPTTASSDACSKIIFDLSAYAGTSFELTFQSSMKYDVANSAPGDNAYFDNIVIEEVTCPLSSNLLTSNLTSTSVDLAWTDGGTATSWEISYGTTGFTAGNGTQVTTSTNPHSLTGLSSSTTYDWYVRAICGQNDFSSWSSVNSFTTLCAPLTAPVLDDVEFHTATTNLTTSLCWTATANNTTNKWNISGNGGTPSSGTGPLSANSGTKFFYFEASGGTAGNEAYLESPLVDLSPLTTPRLTFYYHMFGDGRNIMADLYVEVHNGTSYVLVDSIIGEQQANQADPFYKRAIDLSAFSGISKVRFTAKWNGAQWGDVSIDDIAVEETPSCIAPSSLSTSNLT